MANLNDERIKKLARGELIGHICAGVCAITLAYFIICFTVAEVHSLAALRLAALISAPVIMAVTAGASAFCNLKFGGALERLTSEYVREVFVENAALMHPEKEKLNFCFEFEGSAVKLKVNKFKEEIAFDFSAFGKLSALRRSAISSCIVARLNSTFCRLYERGARLTEVSYTVRSGERQGKPVYIIKDGAPDKKAYRSYRKSR